MGHHWIAGIALAALGCAATAIVPAAPRQEPAAPPPVAPPELPGDGSAEPEPEPIDPWQAAAAVGEHHAHLAAFVGEWEVASRFWPAPDADPVASAGRASNRLILGGRFVQLEYEGAFAGEGGTPVPFSGVGLIGYDNLEQWHVALWMDTRTTAVLAQQGVCDAEGGRLTLTGTFTDPASGERRTTRAEYRFEGPERYVLDLYRPDADGREYRALELVHGRRG